jgi:hypothetical protein
VTPSIAPATHQQGRIAATRQRFVVLTLVLALSIGATAGCSYIARFFGFVAYAATGEEKYLRAGESLGEAFDEFGKAFGEETPQREYYIGRAVTTKLLTSTPVYGFDQFEGMAFNTAPDDVSYCDIMSGANVDPVLRKYVNDVGHLVAVYSDMPESYGGYHFIVVDTDEVNAFAGPGGFVFVSRGAIALMSTEDELACVLGHEVGHVALRHGLEQIASAHAWAGLSKIIKTAEIVGEDDRNKVVGEYDSTASDFCIALGKGFDKDKEYEADNRGAVYAHRAGYDPTQLAVFCQRLADASSGHSGGGWASTHPSAKSRIEKLQALYAARGWSGLTPPQSRTERFDQMIAYMLGFADKPVDPRGTSATYREGGVAAGSDGDLDARDPNKTQ